MYSTYHIAENVWSNVNWKLSIKILSIRSHTFLRLFCFILSRNIHMKKWNKVVTWKRKKWAIFWRKFPQLWITIKISQRDIKFFHLRRCCNITFINKLLQIEFYVSNIYINFFSLVSWYIQYFRLDLPINDVTLWRREKRIFFKDSTLNQVTKVISLSHTYNQYR